jgi:hypothetical protein
MSTAIIPTIPADIKELAAAMIELHGPNAEAEAGRRATACETRGDQSSCEAWWRVEAEIRVIFKADATSVAG